MLRRFYGMERKALAADRASLLAKNELLRLKYMFQGVEELLVKRLVLALEVQHWNCLSRRDGHLLHASMVPVG